MPRIKKEDNFNARRCPNGKYYVKYNNEYIGTFEENQLEFLKKQINVLKEKMTPDEVIQTVRNFYVDVERGEKVSEGMRKKVFKQYNKRLEIGVIAKNKELANYFKCPEELMLTQLINDKYNEIF